MSRKNRYPVGQSRMMRVDEGALIDEHGERIDRDFDFDSDDLDTGLLEAADQLVQLDGRRSPKEITRVEFERLLGSLTDDDEPWIIRYAKGDRSIIGIDVSDCPSAT